jgi:hypothetical protein
MPSTKLLAASCAALLAMPSFHATAAQPADLFDFWLGDWSVTWQEPGGAAGKGRNHVARILDGTVIEEQFEADPASPPPVLRGRSLTVLHKASGTWRQAWVDNQGGYFSFRASVEGDKRIFATDLVEVDGQLRGQRMVFHDIARDSFTWDWEATTDGGKSWTLNWRISYRR